MRMLWKQSPFVGRVVIAIAVLAILAFPVAAWLGGQWYAVPLNSIGFRAESLPCKRTEGDPNPSVTASAERNRITGSTNAVVHVRVDGAAPDGVTWSTGTQSITPDVQIMPNDGRAVTAYIPDGRGGQVSCTVVWHKQ